MGQQHYAKYSDCPSIFKFCYQNANRQGTPFKEQSEERFYFQINTKDLLLSNRDEVKHLQIQGNVLPFQLGRQTAKQPILTENQYLNQPSLLYLPEQSCRKQLFGNGNHSETTNTHRQTYILPAKEIENNKENLIFNSNDKKLVHPNKGLLSQEKWTHKDPTMSPQPSLQSDILTLKQNSVGSKTPNTHQWRSFINTISGNQFLKSNKATSKQYSSNHKMHQQSFILFIQCPDQIMVPDGYREVRYQNGDFQMGHFLDNTCQGQGKYIKNDGSLYEGQFVKGMACGFGVYKGSDGYQHEGEWKDNKPHGKGKVKYKDYSLYEGQLFEGKRHGVGFFVQNGSRYEGEFKNDQLSGTATLLADNGEYFKGQWKQNLIDGHGEYLWPNGDRYVGNYSKGKRNGYGVMYYQNGDIFAGNWKNGFKQGHGTFTTSTTTKSGSWIRSRFIEKEGQSSHAFNNEQAT